MHTKGNCTLEDKDKKAEREARKAEQLERTRGCNEALLARQEKATANLKARKLLQPNAKAKVDVGHKQCRPGVSLQHQHRCTHHGRQLALREKQTVVMLSVE